MRSQKRDDFPISVKELLAKRVGYRCSNPSCRQPTSGPQVDSEGVVNVGVAAHITAAAQGGERYNGSLTPEQRKGADNGIWLCQKCGKLVDNDPIRYPEPKLREWKKVAEELAIREIEGQPVPMGTAQHSPAHGPAHPATRFETELRARNLNDPHSLSFGKTKYGSRLGWVGPARVVTSLPVSGLFFAFMPSAIVSDPSKDGLLRWMNCNERRYEPCRARSFIPSPSFSLVSKGYLWDNSWEIPLPPPAKVYTRYLAVETGGWIEYGFYPGAEWEDQTDRVYYAKVIASLVAFLLFVRDLATTFRLNPAEIGLGLTLIGTTGKRLLCIREEGFTVSYQTQLPGLDSLRFVRPPRQEDWSVDGVAQEAAVEILDHWSFYAEQWVGRPEFRDGVYQGECFKARFHGF
jgi:hypothetical protein